MSKESLGVLERDGAGIDYDRTRSSISGDLVEEALNRARKTIRYAAGNPKDDFLLNKHINWQK